MDGNKGVSWNSIVTSHRKVRVAKEILLGRVIEFCSRRGGCAHCHPFLWPALTRVVANYWHGQILPSPPAAVRWSLSNDAWAVNKRMNVRVAAYDGMCVTIFTWRCVNGSHSSCATLFHVLPQRRVLTYCVTSFDTTCDKGCDRWENKRWTCESVGPSACWKRHINPLHHLQFRFSLLIITHFHSLLQLSLSLH